MSSDAGIPVRKPWQQADLVLYVVDATDFPATLSRQLAAKIDSKTVLVLSKVDLLPAKVTETHIIEWAQEYLLSIGVTFRAIHTMSADNAVHAKKWWIDILKEAPLGNVVIIGAKGVGKSTLHQALQDIVTNPPAKKKRPRRRSRGKARAGATTPVALTEEKTSANMPIKSDDEGQDAETVRPKSPTRRRRRRYVRPHSAAPKVALGEKTPSLLEAVQQSQQLHQQQLLLQPQPQSQPQPSQPEPASAPANTSANTQQPKRTRARRKPAQSAGAAPAKSIAPAPKPSAPPVKAEAAKSEPTAALKLIDTPGYQAGSNLRDLLCAECGARLVPKKRLRSRLLRLRGGQTVVLDELVALGLSGASTHIQAVLHLYVPAAITTRRSTEQKLRTHLQQTGFTPEMCPECKEKLSTNGWEELEVELIPGQDLVINGLGWLNVNQQKVGVRLFLPTGAGASLRPQLL